MTVAKGIKEHSTFLSLMPTVHLLYGGTMWRTFTQELSLSDVSGMHASSASFEVPRLEFSDPEGMHSQLPHGLHSHCDFGAVRERGRETMTPELTKSFITFYLHGLNERTRREKTGRNGESTGSCHTGFAAFGKPVRLPFLGGGAAATIQRAKSRRNLGLIWPFLSEDRRHLIIFVLKR